MCFYDSKKRKNSVQNMVYTYKKQKDGERK